MTRYYLLLGWRSLRRNPLLAALMILAIALGLATSMSALTVLTVMGRDPIPGKSSQLFAAQIDNGGPASRAQGNNEPARQLDYPDAIALLHAAKAKRQVAMYAANLHLNQGQQTPVSLFARATSADFFAMFDVPFRYGNGWSAQADRDGDAQVVLSAALNQRVFAGENSVGRTITLDGAPYQVVGVLDAWSPLPRFYDATDGEDFDQPEDVYLPLARATAIEAGNAGYVYCDAGHPGKTFADLMHSECTWLQFWVELPTLADADAYRQFLINYAAQQRTLGRFHWPPNVRLHDVDAWLRLLHVVPDDAKLSVWVAFAFFAICLVCALSIMLARALERAGEFSLRRALGAARSSIFVQALAESSVIGVCGGVLGTALTLLALWSLRRLFPEQMGPIAHIDTQLFVTTLLVALITATLAGIYPAWRATRVAPAMQLKLG